jgi:hypothetical protein
MTQFRVLIFGLHRGQSKSDVGPLVRPCTESRFAMVDIPGDNDQAMAIVDVGSDPRAAARIRQRVEGRRLDGQTLHSWTTVLPWA